MPGSNGRFKVFNVHNKKVQTSVMRVLTNWLMDFTIKEHKKYSVASLMYWGPSRFCITFFFFLTPERSVNQLQPQHEKKNYINRPLHKESQSECYAHNAVFQLVQTCWQWCPSHTVLHGVKSITYLALGQSLNNFFVRNVIVGQKQREQNTVIQAYTPPTVQLKMYRYKWPDLESEYSFTVLSSH